MKNPTDTQCLNWLEKQNACLRFDAEDEATLPQAVVFLPTLENGESTFRIAGHGDTFREAIYDAMFNENAPEEEPIKDRDEFYHRVSDLTENAHNQITDLRTQLAAKELELNDEGNLHNQTRMVVEDLRLLCNEKDVQIASKERELKETADRLWLEKQSNHALSLLASEVRCEKLAALVERQREILVAINSINITEFGTVADEAINRRVNSCPGLSATPEECHTDPINCSFANCRANNQCQRTATPTAKEKTK